MSSATAVNSPNDNDVATISKPVLTAQPKPRGPPLPLPRRTPAPVRERSLTPLTPLGSPVVTPHAKRKRAKPAFPELSPSPSPPPPPPLPRRKIREPPQQPPSVSKAADATARGREPRESSSPDIQIIEKPVTIGGYAKHKAKSHERDRDREKGKGKVKSEKKAGKKKARASEVIEIDLDSDTQPLRKRRKTDGGAPSSSQPTQSQTGKRPVGRPPKDPGQSQSHSQSQSKKGKGKQPERLVDSSPEPEPASVAVAAAPRTEAKLLADDVSCEWPEIIQGDETYQHEVSFCEWHCMHRR